MATLMKVPTRKQEGREGFKGLCAISGAHEGATFCTRSVFKGFDLGAFQGKGSGFMLSVAELC